MRRLKQRYGHSIEDARNARASQSLDKRMRLDSGETLTKRQFMGRLHRQGGALDVRRVRQHVAEEKLRRDVERREQSVPLGNPNHPETRELVALRDKLKAGLYKEETIIRLPSGTLYEVSKAEADYFKSLAR